MRACNKYIDVTAPWVLAKSEDGKARLGTVLYNLAECLRITAVLLKPFLTHTPDSMFAQLNTPAELQDISRIGFGGSIPGTKVSKGEALFPRIDVAKEIAYLEEETARQKAAAQAAIQSAEHPEEKAPDIPEIEYTDFEKLDLRLGKVLACEEVKRSKKLLKLTVQLGSETRTVVSGIKKWYAPDDLVGKTVVVVANLKPVTLCGVESHGMILCASDEADKNLSIITTLSGMESGLKVR